MLRATALIALVVLPVAGCGDGTDAGGGTDATAPAGGRPAKACTSLSAGDLGRVAAVRPAKREALARTPGGHLRCSILFIDGSGQLILQLTEVGGGREALAALRRGTASELGRSAIRPLPALGPGAFVARRVLGFTSGDRVIELRTGYSGTGRLQLTTGQLRRLAAIVAART